MINPDNILIPNADPDAIEAVGRALKDDAADIAQAGHDITAAWAGLEGHYVAPESEELLAAVDPVAADGDEMDDKITTVGQALIDFAEEIRPLLARWKSLKADAETMAADIAEQGEEWTRDEDRVDEHNQLNNDLAAVQTEYQAAERDCANAITALVEGGTRFVAAELDGSTVPARGEVVYGLAEAPKTWPPVGPAPRSTTRPGGSMWARPSATSCWAVSRTPRACSASTTTNAAGARTPGARGEATSASTGARPWPLRPICWACTTARTWWARWASGAPIWPPPGARSPTPWCPGANGTPGPAM